ncbi:hypothetical protein [[Mycobacterium] manitobense]|uniref:hypothetical protein n=1 Tax=[Mycobacterium] manitobense TaxID=190147 RepID=UPI0021F3A5BA|nr:hypothetical protein [[Mycobacterium] manitobense]
MGEGAAVLRRGARRDAATSDEDAVAPVEATRASRGRRAWIRRFVATTPGMIVLIAATVVATCTVAAVVCAGGLDRRIAEHDTVLERSEPFAYAAQNLYAALSAADAAAASAFLSGGTLSAPARMRYQQALAAASSALVDVTAGATDADTRAEAAEVSTQLATYTGLVELARANNLQEFPVGSAYLREASSLMQTELLPGAERIFARDLAVVHAGQRAVGATPVAGLVLLTVLLAVLLAGSLALRARTNRQVNIGLIVAAAVVVLVMTWIVTATWVAAASIERGQSEGTARFGQLAKARILAQQARTDEMLQLIARGDITRGEESFRGRLDELTGVLGSGPVAVLDEVQRWSAAHDRQVTAYVGGEYNAAVTQAVGSHPNGSAAQFAEVESTLRDHIEQTRAVLRDRTAEAGDALAWTPLGTTLLLALAAVAATAGLWPRLEEFL